jgi:hypothetical protein
MVAVSRHSMAGRIALRVLLIFSPMMIMSILLEMGRNLPEWVQSG